VYLSQNSRYEIEIQLSLHITSLLDSSEFSAASHRTRIDFEPKSRPANKAADTAAINAAVAVVVGVASKEFEFRFESTVVTT
jgi:hypothetical protein